MAWNRPGAFAIEQRRFRFQCQAGRTWVLSWYNVVLIVAERSALAGALPVVLQSALSLDLNQHTDASRRDPHHCDFLLCAIYSFLTSDIEIKKPTA
jgi:hypothetical protein